uniref:Proton channel OTOP2-like n=1 Tax=Geotrypetes seraphini TaxID=260995 RepID=A0A6P8SLA8_GEOSA|nr:proton channel OTOP2-like [Geotrypetes seraphini]XP_033817179.1 proton channel OTOP2-like [Geotrypetes seraphini]
MSNQTLPKETTNSHEDQTTDSAFMDQTVDTSVSTHRTSHLSVNPQPSSEAWKKGGSLLSALLAINMLLIGCAFVSSGAADEVPIREKEVLCFLTVMMMLSIVWMVFQLRFTYMHKDAVLYKDSHAGPIWLRGGLVLFGTCSLALDILKIGYYIGYIRCESPIKIIYPVVQAVFVVFQTYFLWVSCKHCVQIHTQITRYGLMLVLSTNMAVWMAAVTDESVHQSKEIEEKYLENYVKEQYLTIKHNFSEMENITHRLAAAGESYIGCSCITRICHIFEKGFYYMYPFNIEYSLFASAITYVMWKNVGRLIDDDIHHQQQHRLKFCFCKQTLFIGLLTGICMLAVGLVAFISYKINVRTSDNKDRALIMFYIFNIVCLSLMSLGALAGSIIYRFDKREIDNEKNPSRKLDVALLLGATLGQYCISYYSILAMVTISPKELLNCLNLVYALMMVIQHTVQNMFIIEGLHRRSFKHVQHEQNDDPLGLIYINKSISIPFPDDSSSSSPSTLNHSEEPTRIQTGKSTDAMHLTMHYKKNSWKSRILKELSLFLLLCNVICWIMPAFGARLQFTAGLELKFYGLSKWVILTNICLPFGIFYRMHAAASLFEVYVMS